MFWVLLRSDPRDLRHSPTLQLRLPLLASPPLVLALEQLHSLVSPSSDEGEQGLSGDALLLSAQRARRMEASAHHLVRVALFAEAGVDQLLRAVQANSVPHADRTAQCFTGRHFLVAYTALARNLVH